MQSSTLKISFTLFFVVSIIFSTIYTPQAILPVLKQEFHINVLQTHHLVEEPINLNTSEISSIFLTLTNSVLCVILGIAL